MEWVEKTGSSLEEAKEAALDALGVHPDEAEFEVVNGAEKGLFGRVKTEARVRARVAPTTPRAKDDRRRRRGRNEQKSTGQTAGSGQGSKQRNKNASKGASQGGGGRKAPNATKGRTKDGDAQHHRDAKKEKDRSNVSEEATMPLPEQADIAETFVRGLADAMGVDVTASREEVADDEIRVVISGDNIGRMIGQHGSAAMAIDDLTRTVLQRHAGSSRNGRVRVDVGGLRARRATALAAFCQAQAALVREDGISRALEPMGSIDRKVVHDTIADESGVETRSEGEDPNRRVLIVASGDES